jgi:hypothetical protein
VTRIPVGLTGASGQRFINPACDFCGEFPLIHYENSLPPARIIFYHRLAIKDEPVGESSLPLTILTMILKKGEYSKRKTDSSIEQNARLCDASFT